MTISSKKALATICLACSRRPSPRRMLTRGEPPTPTQKATDPSMVTMGPHTPAPARAKLPTSGMLPM